MLIYAGIDEAGYGPLFGPLVVGRAVFVIRDLAPTAPPPQLWQRLSRAVCRKLSSRRGRIAINDSKKLTSASSGIKHLELGCLAFAGMVGHRPRTVDHWLDILGEQTHHNLGALPWYEPTRDHPWDTLPTSSTDGEIAVARGMLTTAAERTGVHVPDLGAAIVFEDRFNRMVQATRSKAATNFTFVSRHLLHLWQTYGQHAPRVVVDHQASRTRYRQLLATDFPDAELVILEETPARSTYRLESVGGSIAQRSMTISFEVNADQLHMPVALASMIAKYSRELLMTRFKSFFSSRFPEVRPTAGYALDAKRFWSEIQPHLDTLAIERDQICRLA